MGNNLLDVIDMFVGTIFLLVVAGLPVVPCFPPFVQAWDGHKSYNNLILSKMDTFLFPYIAGSLGMLHGVYHLKLRCRLEAPCVLAEGRNNRQLDPYWQVSLPCVRGAYSNQRKQKGTFDFRGLNPNP